MPKTEDWFGHYAGLGGVWVICCASDVPESYHDPTECIYQIADIFMVSVSIQAQKCHDHKTFELREIKFG